MTKTLALLFVLIPNFALAEGLEVTGAYAFQPNPAAPNGAVFFRMDNKGEEAVRIVDVKGDIAKRVELHANEMEDGVMKMAHLEEGLELPAGECLLLERGGYHIMLMGLNGDLKAGEKIELALEFENGETLNFEAPVETDHAFDPTDEACIRAEAAKMNH